MLMTEKDFHNKLAIRFLERKCSDKELEVFFNLLQDGKLDQTLSDSMQSTAGAHPVEELPQTPVITSKIPIWRKIAVAAAILAVISVTTVYLLSDKTAIRPTGAISSVTRIPANDALPGTNKSKLTLANGTQIVLDSSNIGVLAKEGATSITNKDGLLVYDGNGVTDKNNLLAFNTMETPRGGQYKLQLSDGSMVWLNAASSIRYPAVFSGNERVVEVSGEAYFEVTKNARMPFRVKLRDGMEIKVLGTHFNVNAYATQTNVYTTLLEGSVSISNGRFEKQIQPGQQARSRKDIPIQLMNDADIEETMAWKNGMFQFNRADIETIMHQMERWYDLEVIYEGAKPTGYYHGEASRNITASEMLKVLKASGLKLKIETRKIIVSP